jgi:hypothetical protein
VVLEEAVDCRHVRFKLDALMVPSSHSNTTYRAMCADVGVSGASLCSLQKSKHRRIVLPYAAVVLYAHAAESRARVFTDYVRAENLGHLRFHRLDPRVNVGCGVLGPCLSSGLLIWDSWLAV